VTAASAGRGGPGRGGTGRGGPYLLAVDAGTGSCRTLLFTEAGEPAPRSGPARTWTAAPPARRGN
jgi:hypothetical protein